MKSAKEEDALWFPVDISPWGHDFRPVTLAAASYDKEGVNVYLRSYEQNIRCVEFGRNAPVHNDSCLEFFFAPLWPDVKSYFNFEMNPAGALYTGFSPTGLRANTAPVADEIPAEYFGLKTAVIHGTGDGGEGEGYNGSPAYWEAAFYVSYEYIKGFLPQFNPGECKKIAANFYKCGDLTENEHYLAWSEVKTPAPDFHVPEYFGELSLE